MPTSLISFGAAGIASRVSRAVSRTAKLIFRCIFVVISSSSPLVGAGGSRPGDPKSVLRRWRRKGEAADIGDCKIKGRSYARPNSLCSLRKV